MAAAAGIALLGQTTVAARLPFALAALASVGLLRRLTRSVSGDGGLAAVAAALLVANAGWMLQARQARYYALSSLCLLLVLAARARWQWASGGGLLTFVATAWLWCQIDCGTVWPVVMVLRPRGWPRRATGRHRWRPAGCSPSRCSGKSRA